MNHKEEAQQLVDLFYNLFKVELENSISWHEAKQCAIICCNEIIEMDIPGYPTQEAFDKWLKDWQQVKEAILEL